MTAANDTAATSSEASALILGLRPRRTVEKIFIGSVVASGPATKLEITTSSSDSVNASSQPDSSAGAMIGSVITKNTLTRVAPRSIAASSSDLSRSARREDTITDTNARVKVTCAMKIDSSPLGDTPSGPARVTNISSSDRPVTTSGITIGEVTSAPSSVLPRNGFKSVSTSAASVPSTIDAVADSNATFRLTQAALIID